ncbi:hypothetical protein DF213_17385 [Dickeya dianthicola]|uniref:Uncharacterized protein n=1 Tax=Dickeya dianthicola TaxID=204039 RepID=A0AAX1C277_9GAMM|nr:hypothetical protein DF213_17385 [Dickeya dianthicola]
MLYPSYFKLQVRWLRSITRITYLSKLIGIPSLATCLKLELFRVYRHRPLLSRKRKNFWKRGLLFFVRKDQIQHDRCDTASSNTR